MWSAVHSLRDAVRSRLARALGSGPSAFGSAIVLVASKALGAPAVGAPPVAPRPEPSSLSIPGSAAQKSLAVELAADGLWLSVCSAPRCRARAGRAIELPPEARGQLADSTLESLELPNDRRLGHARIALPTPGTAWEALFAAPIGGNTEPLVIFAGITGAVQGEDGARAGDMLWIREGDNPLPCKIVITTTSDPSMPQYSAVLNWEPRQTFADGTFTYSPSASSRRIALGSVPASLAPTGN